MISSIFPCHFLGAVFPAPALSGVTGGGRGEGQGVECPTETSDQEIFADILGKMRQGKKGKGVKIEKKRRKIVKEKVENWKWK